MKRRYFEHQVEESCKRLSPEELDELKSRVRRHRPPELVDRKRMVMRRNRLFEADVQPSPVSLERILGANDLVDVNYLLRALNASRSVCRVVLRDDVGREIGYGTGFKVAPHLLLTNWHVLEDADTAANALAEFDYELDASGYPRRTTRFELMPHPGGFFLNDQPLDFALVAVAQKPLVGTKSLESFGFMRLQEALGKINEGEFVTIIQHPGGQPKQIALRENKLLQIGDPTLWYQSDTAQGSSGSPVLNDSWQIVALHHSGVPRKDAAGHWLLKNGQPAGPDADDSDIDWIANEGIRISRIVKFVDENAGPGTFADEFRRAASGAIPPSTADVPIEDGSVPGPGVGLLAPSVRQVPGGAKLTVPLSLLVSVQGLGGQGDEPATAVAPTGPSTSDAQEKYKLPIVDTDYDNRTGYDENFLGIEVPVPTVRRKSKVAKMDNGSHLIPYEHFSVVMDKARRLALFTVSNVDANDAKKEPEPGRNYTRDGLGGFGKNDIEKWLTDPRIPQNHQLPDKFYSKDHGAFDKGHIVRRDDVTWGDSYAQVRRANGDTYHTTNCSPQVKNFNRSQFKGLWGKLENTILKQAETEKYCLIAGPLLDDDDRIFVGRDDVGEVRIQIPKRFWKIVVAKVGNKLQAFGFLLEQDLGDVPLEFAVEPEWKSYMISLVDLDKQLKNVRLPAAIKHADQFEVETANEVMSATELAGLERYSPRRSEVAEAR